MNCFLRLCAALLLALPLGGCVTGPGDGSWADKANLLQMTEEASAQVQPRPVAVVKTSKRRHVAS